MKRIKIMLNFKTHIHFGVSQKGVNLERVNYTMGSNQLFSAMLVQYIKYKGDITDKDIEIFKNKFENEEIKISNLFPYEKINEKIEYYLPKPKISYTTEKYTCNEKELKKVEYVRMANIVDYINGKKLTDIKGHGKKNDFVTEDIIEKTQIKRDKEEDNEIYIISGYTFKENKGLYFILEYKNEKDKNMIISLIKLLSYTGLGGKRSIGYGQFDIEVDDKEDNVIESTSKMGEEYMLISDLLLTKNNYKDISEGNYSLCQYNGYTTPMKNKKSIRKKMKHYVEAGAIFKKEIKGNVEDIGTNESKALFYGTGMYYKY